MIVCVVFRHAGCQLAGMFPEVFWFLLWFLTIYKAKSGVKDCHKVYLYKNISYRLDWCFFTHSNFKYWEKETNRRLWFHSSC